MALYVAVCGPDPCTQVVAAQAEEVGRLLARSDTVLVCGGYGGAMEAAAKGAAEEGGVIIGILSLGARTGANPYLTYSIPTGMGELRNGLVVRAADAVIAVAGEYGTLSEIAFALKIGVPVVGLGTWELSKAGRPVEAFLKGASPAEAVEAALRLAGERVRTARA